MKCYLKSQVSDWPADCISNAMDKVLQHLQTNFADFRIQVSISMQP